MSGRIVVGVDGSEGSRRALAWALEEAAIRASVVRAVMVWEGPLSLGEELAYPVDEAEMSKRTRTRLAKALAEVAGAHPDVEIEPVVLGGDPATLLCEQSREGDLLVVGSRGHGGLVGSLLGSVSNRCAHVSPRPVAIVPLH